MLLLDTAFSNTTLSLYVVFSACEQNMTRLFGEAPAGANANANANGNGNAAAANAANAAGFDSDFDEDADY
jgi:hypothetical protein